MLPNKIRAVLKALGSSLTDEARQPPPKITVIFIVAIAIRKFQKFESNNFKKSLTYDFDKQAALEELRRLHTADKEFFKKDFAKLAYFTRKFNLTFQDLSSLDDGHRDLQIVHEIFGYLKDRLSSFEEQAFDRRTLHFLCVSLKFLTRNSSVETNTLEIASIVELCKACSFPDLKNALASLLMSWFEKLNTDEQLSNEDSNLLSSIVDLPDLSADAVAFFLTKLESNKQLSRSAAGDSLATTSSMVIPKVKKNQQVVSKTTQTVRSKHETKTSEETDFQLLNLSDCMKNRNRKINCNTVLEDGFEDINKDGDDRSIFRDTWHETINLYSLVSRGEVLKTDDKDNYLPSKFFGHHFFNSMPHTIQSRPIYSFVINWMCTAIFQKISRKQQLNDQAINKLLKCVRSFEELVRFFNLNTDFAEQFVRWVLHNYWEVKALTCPDMAVRLFKEIMDKTTEEYEERGWFYTSRKVRRKAYDGAVVEEIIITEINAFRLDAIKALYNCALRNKQVVFTEKRLEKIRAYAESPDKGKYANEAFLDRVIKLIELAETLDNFDYKKMFQMYLGHFKNSESLANIMLNAVLRFMNNQARDMKRCEELFTDNVMTTIIGCLSQQNSHLSDKQKVEIVRIINTYLEHETTKALSENNLETLLDSCLQSGDEMSLIKSGLTSLLLSTCKTQSLASTILEKLIEVFHLLIRNEDCTSFILFILSRVFCADRPESRKQFLSDSNFVKSISTKLFCNHIVRVSDDDDEGETVKFDESSSESSYNSSNQISLLTAKTIWRSVANKVLLSSVTIDNLILVLTSSKNEEEKQTKIVVAKCLNGLTKYMALDTSHLNQLLDLIDSPIYDVGIYVQAAYMRECAKVAYTPLPVQLDPIHLENISSLYVSDSLKLGQDDYEGEINKNLFRTLLYEARKQKFNDKNIFLLFDKILILNEKYAHDVLAILVAYTFKYVVPQATVRTLETLLTVSDCFEKALLILENVIFGGQSSVTNKTLTVFTDYLHLSINGRLRFYSFKLLEKASQNQELPDDIFYQAELVRAGYALERFQTDNKQAIIKFIQELVDKGMQLPIDTRQALEKEISNADVLEIFGAVSKNKQIIDEHLLDALIDLFVPTNSGANKINARLIKIFENAAKNNQKLPERLLVKLEAALSEKDLEKIVLPVFIYLAQKGEILPQRVNHKLLDKLDSEHDPVLRQELLSSLGSLIDANQQDIQQYLPKINAILTTEIKSDNQNIQKLGISTVNKLVAITRKIDDRLLEMLVEVGTDLNVNKTIRYEVKALFELVIKDNYNPLIRQKGYREKIFLTNLSCKSPRDLLDQLRCYIKLGDGFVVQNYKQLKDIIDNDSVELQEEALNLLHDCTCKSKMTDELLESVAILYESTMTDKLKNSCLQLFTEAVESGKPLSGRAGAIWGFKQNRDNNVKKFFQSRVCTEMQQEFQLTEGIILDLLRLSPDVEKAFAVEELADFIQAIVDENSDDCWKNASFIFLIALCLITARNLEITLPCYCRIIKENKCSNVEYLEGLAEYFMENEDSTKHLETTLFECMYYTSKLTQLSPICMLFASRNLISSNEIIRGYSFAILRSSKDIKYSEIFKKWCDLMLGSLAENLDVQVEKSKDYLDILEIIASTKFLDIEVFRTKTRDTWKRELLASDIFEKFKVSRMDQVYFYSSWFTVQDKFMYHKSYKILSLIQKCNFRTFSQITELALMIADFQKFDDVQHLLVVHGPEPYEAFKQEWCIRKLETSLSNKDGINAKYSSKLAEKLCSSFEVKFISKLFRCLKEIVNLFAFEDLVSFCLREKIDLEPLLDVENVQLNDLRNLIEAKHLCRCANSPPESEIEEKDFHRTFQLLKNAAWNFVQLRELVTAFNPISNKFRNLLHFLNTVQIYGLTSSNFEKTKQILIDANTFKGIMCKISKLAIENHFQLEGKVKDIHELVAELKDSNQSDRALMNFIATGSLDIRKHIFEDELDKFKWNEKQIQLWAKGIKREKRKFSDYEAIAIIFQANFLITGHRLTDVQILCCLIALRQGALNGKLLEVATGEGKSTIICILAIISTLRGKTVDVITSSPVLAERDAKDKAKLYRMFGLTCCENNDKTVYLKGRKDCYLADVVYGEMSQFQFDILRDTYSKLGTLGKRKCETAIVDEVDSMLIDDSSKIARLSSTVPGMDHFQTIYVFIWQCLMSVKAKFIMFKNKMYFVDGKVGFANGKIILQVADNNGNIVNIPDLETYILTMGDESQYSEVVDDLDDYLRKKLGQYLDHQMKENRLYFPSNFAEFVAKQKSKWITNAVEALNYQENIHYVVQDGEIKPVDYYSTGIVQSSTNWSDGLHQFLQLKHNLKMTSETLTTNFLSNIGFINKYDQVYGLTGTLGSKTARTVLKDVYKVDLINIPQRRQKQYMELTSVVAEGESDWLNQIMSNILLEIQKDRGTLVICETIEHANRISGMLKNKLRSSSVKLYTMNDMNQEKNVEKILPGEVIIATNLAGRGTDIRTDEIEATGGLHVILTFMPSNQRVEDQAFGRTARQGKRGTGLMILNTHNLVNYSTKENVKEARDELESEQLMEFREKDLKLIQVKDKLFDKFCTFLNDSLRTKIRQQENSYVRQAVNFLIDLSPTTYESCMLAAVEEQWAGFLSKLDEGMIKCEDAESKCNTLIAQLENDYANKNLITNSYYYITIANDILINNQSSSTKIKQALAYFMKAIELEENYWQKKETGRDDDVNLPSKENRVSDETDTRIYGPGAAHLGVAWCLTLLRQGENYAYKGEALASLKRALESLSNEMSALNAIQLLLQQKQTGFANSDLYKQLNIKATILGSYIRGVSSCIDAVKRSKRLIDVISVKNTSKNDDDISQTIEHFNEQMRNEKDLTAFENDGLTFSSTNTYSLTFNHLTRREDFGTIDQALETLKNAYDEQILKNLLSAESKKDKLLAKFKSTGFNCLFVNYDDITINLKRVDLARIKSDLFNPDKEFKDLTRESAMAKLKEERSYCHAIFRLIDSYGANLKISSNDERKVNMKYENKTINALIGIVEEQQSTDTALRFDILIKKANENLINIQFMTKDEKSIKLNLVFENLNRDDTKAKLNSIKATSFDVEFVLHKSALIKLINSNATLKSGILHKSDKQPFEKFEVKKLLDRINRELKTDETGCFVRFDDLSLDQIRNIVDSCPENTVFVIHFKNIYDYYSSELNEGQANVFFNKLNQEDAAAVINLLREKNFEFSLELNNLSDKQARFVLKHANLDQEHMKITKVKKITDLFMSDCLPKLELNEFVSKGIEYIIEMNENQFVPWWSVCTVAALGVGQVIIGGWFIVTGFGASVGISLVTEGISDMLVAYRAYSTRQFRWSDYCMQKAVSLALSAVSMGFSKLKDAAKGIETVTTGVGKELLEQAATQVITNKQAVAATLNMTRANLKGLTCKFIAVKASEAVAREVLNIGIQYLSNFTFDQLKPTICESIQRNVRTSFNNSELLGLLYKMHAIDLATNSSQLQTRVEQIVLETINPRHDVMNKMWNSIGLPLIKGVLSDSSRYGSTASMAIRITGTLNGLQQVLTLTNYVVESLIMKLKSLDSNSMTMTLVFHTYLKINKNNAQVIANKLKRLQIFSDKFDNFYQNDSVVNTEIENFAHHWQSNRGSVLKELGGESESMADDIEKSIDFVKRFHGEFVKIEMDSFNMIMKAVSDQISEQLIRITDSQLLQPWTTLAVSSVTDSVSKRIQHYCLVNKQQNSESQNADQKKYDELSKKENLSAEEAAFIASYGKFRTFAEQINYNTRDYCIAYSQCEMIYYAGKNDDVNSSMTSSNVQEAADDVRNGSPANVAVMVATAKLNGVNLKVVDNKDYVLTEEDKRNKVQVIHIEHGANNEIGHAYYMDNSTGQFIETPSTGYDCFFDAFSQILASNGIIKSGAALRAEVANHMESKPGNFMNALAAENWIRRTHPESANSLVFTAGLKKVGDRLVLEEGDTEKQIEDMETGKKRGGTKYKDDFRDTVPRQFSDNENREEDKVIHHIIPYAGIKESAIGSYNQSSEAYEMKLGELINNPTVRPVIELYLDDNGQLKEGHNVGQILHAATAWFPNNLVRGPENRGNDPKNTKDPVTKRPVDPKLAIDKELRDIQSPDFQNKVNAYGTYMNAARSLADDRNVNLAAAFDCFRTLPEAQQTSWTKDGPYRNNLKNKYSVDQPIQNNGNEE